MGRPTKPVIPEDLQHRSPSWSPLLTRGIGRRLAQKLPDILKSLNSYPESLKQAENKIPLLIDLVNHYAECEEDIEITQNRKARIQRPLGSIRQHFEISDSTSDKTLQELVSIAMDWQELLEDLVVALLVGLATSLDYDDVPTVSGVRRKLRSLLKVADSQLVDAITRVDGSTRGLILHHWVGKRAWEADREFPVSEYRQSIEKALSTPYFKGKGRPTGSNKLAAETLGKELGIIYKNRTGRQPKISKDFDSSEITGPFHRFVSSVVSIVPGKLLVSLHGHTTTHKGTIETISQRGAKQFQE